MNVEDLLGDVIRGALTARGKKHRGALRALTGRGSSLVTPATLLGALGVAWGLYETLNAGSTPAAPPAPTVAPPVPGSTPGAAPTSFTPPPVQVAPPVPPPAAPREVPGVAAEVARVIRLTVSAARADGTLNPTEESAILAHARQAGAEAVVQDELARPTPLATLVSGAPEATRPDLYALAFAIVRADEAVSGGERIYLAQLAHALGLDQPAVAAIEARASGSIDAAAKAG
jgi:uncharacterized membrane protein YebE (DUF533 family)